MVDKEVRQAILKEMIQQQKLTTQDELLHHLQAQGVNVTQSTISRDMKDIGVVKQHQEDGSIAYVLQESIDQQKQIEHLTEMLQEHVVAVTPIQFVLLIRTTIEMANVIAALFDEGLLKEVVGTIAGADTIVVFCRNENDCQNLAQRLEQMMKKG